MSGIARNARPAARYALNALPVEVKPVPIYSDDDDLRGRMFRAGNRHKQRLHMARLGLRHLPWPRQHEGEPRCVECGTEISNTTDGCSTCAERVSRRARRAKMTEAERAKVREADRLRQRAKR